MLIVIVGSYLSFPRHRFISTSHSFFFFQREERCQPIYDVLHLENKRRKCLIEILCHVARVVLEGFQFTCHHGYQRDFFFFFLFYFHVVWAPCSHTQTWRYVRCDWKFLALIWEGLVGILSSRPYLRYSIPLLLFFFFFLEKSFTILG